MFQITTSGKEFSIILSKTLLDSIMTYSFDIFDTCLVRKCGTPDNMFDVLSLLAFKEPVSESVRQEFVVARKRAECQIWSNNPFGKLHDIYENLNFEHPALHSRTELERIDIELENTILVPVIKMKDRIDSLRSLGHHIIFISDMYLPESVIRPKMEEYGFMKDNDSMYISCEVGKRKQDGSLYQFIQEKEGLKFCCWRHIGDNTHSDYLIPKQLGIKAETVDLGYNPYPQSWKNNDKSLGLKYPSIIAGLNRSLSLSNPKTTNKDFVLDIIAPLYCSWVYHILEDASCRGIKRLFFCSRDAYQIHKIAQNMQPLFPKIGIEYIFISRTALYNEDNDAAKIAYFKKVGLASITDDVAIVDTTTTGKTLVYLNRYLTTKGFSEVFGYYCILYSQYEHENWEKIDCKLFEAYIKQNNNFDRWLKSFFVFELFFGLSNEYRTIDYRFVNGIPEPVFSEALDSEDGFVKDEVNWPQIEEDLLAQYTDSLNQMQLGQYMNKIFDNVAITTIANFFQYPDKYYLKPLSQYYFGIGNKRFLPIIKKMINPLELRIKNRPYYWRRASIIYSLPKGVVSIIRFLRFHNGSNCC